MCGHIGMVGELLIRDDKIFKQGLVVDALRGEHSTGILAVPKNGDVPVIVKQVGNPYELFNDKRFDKAMLPANRVLLGHNRFATHGAVNKANAHPFDFGHIYGAHNGTLTQWHTLHERAAFQVDSQALYNHIAHFGIEEAIEKIQGAWALVWWNEEEQSMNFLRNGERTLYTCFSEDGKVLYWASEHEMLSLLLNRNGVKYKALKILPIDTWIRFTVGKDGALSKPKAKKVAAKKFNPPVVQSAIGGKTQHNPGVGTATALGTFNSKVIRSGVSMEVGRKQLDGNKACYALCTDAEFPNEKIRLYMNQGDQFKWKEGFVVIGNIQGYVYQEGGFYKVTNSSVRCGTLEEQVRFDEAMGRLEENKKKVEEDYSKKLAAAVGATKKFLDHKGNKLTKEEWEKKYPCCAWCTIELSAEDDNHVTKDGDALCPDCSNNNEVKMYL